MMTTFAERVIAFNKSIEFHGNLPEGIRIMNPFKENKYALPVSTVFYEKYYNDLKSRHLILGINPGRFGGGITGIPFTDPKRLTAQCGIDYDGPMAHEPSSVFVYDVIDAYGSAAAFYSSFYIHSICPLGFTALRNNGKEVNYNYYDSKELTAAVYDFIIDNIQKQINLGVETDLCYCFGTGKNEKFLSEINRKYGFFKRIIPLEHPRFIMQYKSKFKQEYINKYLQAFELAQR